MMQVIRQYACLFVAGALAWPAVVHAAAVPGSWTQTFAADFDTGAADLAGWTYETGNNNGWGNNELETYTTSTTNVSVSGGNLHLTAVASGSGANRVYTSGRIKTSGLFTQAYGLFEFRAKMPAGQGLWPAIWMMPASNTYGGWPTSGEIDILETQGQATTLVQGSTHSGTSPGTQNTQTRTLAQSGLTPAGFSTTDFHTYDLQWDKGTAGKSATLKWYVDGVLYQTQQGGWSVPGGAASSDAPFDKPFYLILNLAVGGDYVGAPNLANGAYDMQVDYARAYTATVPEPAGLGACGAATGLLRRRRRSVV